MMQKLLFIIIICNLTYTFSISQFFDQTANFGRFNVKRSPNEENVGNIKQNSLSTTNTGNNVAPVFTHKNNNNNPPTNENKPIANTKHEDIKGKEKTSKKKNLGNKPVENKNVGNNNTLPIVVHSNFKEDLIQSGALLRGFYVFLGLSVLCILYFLFRSYRLRHGSQPFTMVRKYGITARKSDMEMRPLELEDDEDDNTLFEINNQNINR